MYKYEMHIHSCPCSNGGDDIIDHIDTLISKGYAGMVITNHFYHGDTGISRSLPWSEFVGYFRDDFERGQKYAKAHDFDLLFGIEEGVGYGKEILIYGITPEFLESNPCLRDAGTKEYVRLVHEAGGVVFQAHPYRDRFYITDPGPIDELDILDGIEVYNAGNTDEDNAKATVLAKEKGLRCTAGSDGHSTGSAGRAGIITYARIRTNKDLAYTLKSGNCEIYRGE